MREKKSWFARTPYGIAVLRYDEVNALIRDQRLRQGSYAWPAHNKATGSFADWWIRMLLSREGADHSRLRRLANPAFAPKLVRKLTPVFQDMANEIIDGFSKKGTCEFVADFSEPYATQVICALLGLPRSEWRGLAQLAVDMGLALGVTFKQDEAKINAATDKLFGYAAMAVEALKKNGLGDDFRSLLVKANEEDKTALSDQELYDMIVLAIFGGIDTTRNQIALAMDMFVQHPDQWKLLGEDPELARAAVEEVMRVRPTVTWVTREALEDFNYQGLDIKKGHDGSPVQPGGRYRSDRLRKSRVRYHGQTTGALRFWRRRSPLHRSLHCSRRHDRSLGASCKTHQKPSLQWRSAMAAG